jgi:hypothetical protein
MENQLNKFSKELNHKELLEFMIIIFHICRKEDITELKRFLNVVSGTIGPEDFNKLLRRVMKMMGSEKCGKDLCSDWLMTKLYELYKSFN